jgi:hypothetical protein
MTNLEALRAIANLAASRGPLDRVDADRHCRGHHHARHRRR